MVTNTTLYLHILGVTNESVVTASHAIFVEKGGYKAPVAVVGLQYRNSAFRETFFNITSGVSAFKNEIDWRNDGLDANMVLSFLFQNGIYIVHRRSSQLPKNV